MNRGIVLGRLFLHVASDPRPPVRLTVPGVVPVEFAALKELKEPLSR